ncbi:MAG: TIGR02281 family clan AA aspartic protease, partial [Burkholderiales bacterium]
HFIAILVWLGLIGVGYVAFQYFDRATSEITGCDGPQASQEVQVSAARDGHFYLDGAVNGTPLRFLVDTGASYVTIGAADAAKAGVAGGHPAIFNTAAGRVEGRVVPGQKVRVACFEIAGISVAANPGLEDMALLGQNFLRRFEVTQTRQTLRLRPRPAAEKNDP